MADALFEALFTEELFLIKPGVIVVIAPSWADLTREEKLKLSEILKAVKLTLEGVQIIEQPELDLAGFGTKPDRVIYFGPQVAGLVKYELIQANGTSLVLSDPLRDLLKDDTLRKKLWGSLRQLFNL